MVGLVTTGNNAHPVKHTKVKGKQFIFVFKIPVHVFGIIYLVEEPYLQIGGKGLSNCIKWFYRG